MARQFNTRFSGWFTAALLLLGGSVRAFAQTQWSRDSVKKAGQAVVQVIATECRGNDKGGTGFVWREAGQVITALHVINGCGNISVYFESEHVSRQAQIARVLKNADLAMLRILKPPIVTPLGVQAFPHGNDQLRALGYGSLQKMTDRILNVPILNPIVTLEEWVPVNARFPIQKARSPDLKLEVLNVEGFVVHGFSGAPIIDKDGRVAAVVDGGLEIGSGTSWAIPIKWVESLIASQENITAVALIATQTDVLFASDIIVENIPPVKCGYGTFSHDRTRSFQQLLSTTDNPELTKKHQQLIDESYDEKISELSFDIYVDSDSGATIALPQNFSLKPVDGGCMATGFNGTLQMFVAEYQTGNVAGDIEAIFNQMTSSGEIKWVPIQATAISGKRSDGLQIRRAFFDGFDPADPGWRRGRPTTIARAYQAALGRDRSVLAVAWMMNDRTLSNLQEMFSAKSRCEQSPDRGCERLEAIGRLLFKVEFAAELSTFPYR